MRIPCFFEERKRIWEENMVVAKRGWLFVLGDEKRVDFGPYIKPSQVWWHW